MKNSDSTNIDQFKTKRIALNANKIDIKLCLPNFLLSITIDKGISVKNVNLSNAIVNGGIRDKNINQFSKKHIVPDTNTNNIKLTLYNFLSKANVDRKMIAKLIQN